MSAERDAVVIIGAGGHARVVAGLLARLAIPVATVLDEAPPRPGERIGGAAVTGTLEDLPRWWAAGYRSVVLAIGDNRRRADASARATAAGFAVRGLRHPTAIVEAGADVAPDAVVCAGAIIGAEARIGANVLVNTGAVVDHESVIGAHVHLGPRATIAGRVAVGVGTFVGMGASVIDGVRVGAGVMVGAGAAVVDDLPDDVVALGVPARVRHDLHSPWRRVP